VGWTRHFADAPILMGAVVLLAVHLAALVESLRIVLWDLLRSRRTRDWLILLSSLAGILIYVAQSFAFRRAMLSSPGAWLSLHPSRYLHFLPSALVADAAASSSAGHYGASLGFLAALAALAAATIGVMSLLVRRVQAGEVESGGWARRERARERPRMRRWVALPIPAQVATVARKDLLMFRRDPRLKIQVIGAAFVPVAWAAFMVFSSPLGGGIESPTTFFAALAMLFGSFMLSANAFGFEGDAASTLFLFPAPRRAIVAGKNLALWTVLMAVYAPALILLAGLGRQWAALPLALVFAGGALALSLGVGNLLSIYAPYRLPSKLRNPIGTHAGPGCAGLVLSAAGFLVSAVLALPLAAALVLPMMFDAWPWYVITIPAGLGYAWVVYRALLGLAAQRLQAREPEIIEAVGSASGE